MGDGQSTAMAMAMTSSLNTTTLVELQYKLSSSSLFAADPLPTTHDPFTPLHVRFFPGTSRPRRGPGYTQQQGGPVESSSSKATDDAAHLKAQRRWRALADLTAQQIVHSRDSKEASLHNIHIILELWLTRFACLQKLHFLAILANESGALGALLPSSYTTPLRPYTRADSQDGSDDPEQSTSFFHPVLPFSYILYRASLPLFLGGDQYLMLRHLREVAQGCRQEWWRGQGQGRDSAWQQRLLSTQMMLANVLVVLHQHRKAVKLLRETRRQFPDSADLGQALFLLLLEMGDVAAAQAVRKDLDGSSSASSSSDGAHLDVLLLAAQGRWRDLEKGLPSEDIDESNDPRHTNNEAVAALYTGQRQKALKHLHTLRESRPDEFFDEETYIANLITLQELGSGDQIRSKLELVRQASEYSSEGFRVECFKL